MLITIRRQVQYHLIIFGMRYCVCCDVHQATTYSHSSLTLRSTSPASQKSVVHLLLWQLLQLHTATHVDIALDLDEERVSQGKKSLARWIHGLSAVEPHQSKPSHSSRHLPGVPLKKKEGYSPITNYLLTREMPVSVDSVFEQDQMTADFQSNNFHEPEDSSATEKPMDEVQLSPDVEPDGTTEHSSTTPTTTLILTSVAMTSIASTNPLYVSMPVITLNNEGHEELTFDATADSGRLNEISHDSAKAVESINRCGDVPSSIIQEPCQDEIEMGELFDDLLQVLNVSPTL